MRVLVLHQHYWPEIAATAQLLADLCEDLVSYGHDVRVVCGQPSYRRIEGISERSARESRHGVQIERVWSYRPSARGIPQRLAHYGSYFGTSLLAALTHEKPDVCFVMSTPPLLLGISGALLGQLRGTPFVYSVQDLYPDVAVHLGVIRADGHVARVVDAVARGTYRAASALITLSLGMGARLSAKGATRERIHVIPNWADTSQLQPAPRDNPFAQQHGLKGRFVVSYAGNLGQSQGLEHVVTAAHLLRELPITFAFTGDGNARASLENLTRRYALTNVRFLPPQPRERLSELLSACDVGLVTMRAAVSSDLVPSKLYGIMATGRPVLASVPACSEVARVIHDHRCGSVVEPENPEALAQSIVQLYHMSERERATLGQNGRAACSAHYSRPAATRRYESVLKQAALPSGTARSRLTRSRSPAWKSAESV